MTISSAIRSEEGHWKNHAIRWDLIGPPLRPTPDELDVVAGIVSELTSRLGDRGLDALVLGVTLEYARFPWPPGSNLTALEHGAVDDPTRLARLDGRHRTRRAG